MSIFNPKHINIIDKLERQRFLLIWQFSLVFSFAFFLLSIFFFAIDLSGVYAYAGATVVCSISAVYLYKSQKSRIIYFIYSIIGTIIIHSSLFVVIDFPHAAEFLWIIFVILLAFFGLGKRWGIVILIANILLLNYFVLTTYDLHLIEFGKLTVTEKITLCIELSICLSLITYIVYQFISSRELANKLLIDKNLELRQSNELISKQNLEKTILVKEIHHRVKNNLQIIISLLRLQTNELKSKEAKKHFSEAINRIMVMSSVHQKLYQETDVADFDLQNYVLELAKELKDFYKENYPIDLNVTANYHKVNLKTIVPMGLILNELLSNSFKYAFENQSSGIVEISIDKKGDQLIMNYTDNGKWVKPKDEHNGFGTELIDLLTEQLDGKKTFKTDESGTHYNFSFQEIKKNNEK